MMIKKIICILFTLIANASLASEFQSLQNLEELAFSHVNNTLIKNKISKFTIKIRKLDTRLRLPTCPNKQLIASTSHHSSIERASTVAIKCSNTPNDWKIYVPFKIRILTDVIVAARTLPKGTLLTESDFKKASVDSKKLRSAYFTQASQVKGLITKSTIYSGRVITAKKLRLPQLISRGDPVTITAINSAIRVSMKGIAIENGRLGDRIRVKNLSSSQTIDAKIVAKQQVEIKI